MRNKHLTLMMLCICSVFCQKTNSNTHKHHAGIFLGVTNNIDAEHTSFTLAVEYEYKLSKIFGIGFINEYLIGKHPESILALPVYYHVTKSITLLAAQGKVWPEHGVGHNLTRFAVMYGLHIGKLSLTPTFAYDIISHNNSIIGGVSLGLGF